MRRRVQFAGVMAAFCALAYPLPATPTWSVDSGFAPLLVDETDVGSSATVRPAPGGGYVVWGFFTDVDDVAMPRIARLDATSARVPGFVSPFDANTTVLAAEAIDAGRTLVLLRRFSTSGGGASSDVFIVRLLASGALDPTFTEIAVAGAGDFVRHGDGRVTLYGNFSLIAQPSIAGLARFSSAGVLDATWAPRLDGSRVSATHAVGGNDGSVFAVAGPIEGPGRATLSRVRFDGATGSGTRIQDSNTPTASELLALAKDGALLVANHGPPIIDFVSTPGGGTQIVTRYGLARYRADGTRDATFAGLVPDATNYNGIAVLDDGRIAVDASLSEPGQTGSRSVFILTAGGTAVLDVRSLLPAPRILELTGVAAGGELLVRQASVLKEDGFFYLPGTRENAAGDARAATAPPLVSYIGRTLTRASLTTGSVTAVPLRMSQRTSGRIDALRLDATGRILVAGAFTEIGGIRRAGLARFGLDRVLDTGFVPPEFGAEALSIVAPDADGGLLVAIVRVLQSASAIAAERVVEVRRLRADGTLDPGFEPDARLTSRTAQTRWLLTAPDGRRLVAYFAPVDAGPARLRLAWTNTAGSLVEELPVRFADASGVEFTDATNTSIFPLPNPIAAAVRLGDGRLLVAGGFDRVDGLERPLVARLRINGTVDPSHRGEFNNRIHAHVRELQSDGHVVIHETVPAPRNGEPSTELAYRLRPDGSRIPGRILADPNLPTNITLPDSTPAFVIASVHAPDGSLWSRAQVGGGDIRLVRFTPFDAASITVQPESQAFVAGADGFLRLATGTAQAASIQWYRNNTAIAGATGEVLELGAVPTSAAGTYHATVGIGGFTLTTQPAVVTVRPNTARVVNCSARSQVAPGRSLISGFVVEQGGTSPALIRGVGYGLVPYLAPPYLPDPILSVHAGPSLLGTDRGSITSVPVIALAASYGAFPMTNTSIPPVGASLGSALLRPLGAGVHTIQVSSGDGLGGTALAECYTGGSDPARITNVSVRTRTSPGARPTALGFVIAGDGPTPVLVRVVGPGLTAFGVADAETDPRLELRSVSQSATAARNDEWHATPALLAATTRAGAFPLSEGGADAATLVTLQPGAYTLEVSGRSPAGGEVLLEVYLPGF